MKLLIPTMLAICCCYGAEPAVPDPARASTSTTVQSPIDTYPYEVIEIVVDQSGGKQDFVKLASGSGKPVDEGTEFVIQRGNVYIVTVRAVKNQNGLVECRAIPESWNAQNHGLSLGDRALVRQVEKKSAKPSAPATDQAPAPSRKFEGPFDPVLCLDGSRRSPREWVLNPYDSVSENNRQREMRKRLAPSITVDLNEISLRKSLEFFFRVTGVSIVLLLDPSEEPTVTLNLQDVPVYDHIGYLCEVTDLFFRVDDHAIVIFRGHHHYHYRE